MKKMLFIFALLVFVGCTRPEKSTRVLEDAGYKAIVITGWRPFACDDKSDTFATGWRATSTNTGRTVTGVVCDGLLFKGATIRVD